MLRISSRALWSFHQVGSHQHLFANASDEPIRYTWPREVERQSTRGNLNRESVLNLAENHFDPHTWNVELTQFAVVAAQTKLFQVARAVRCTLVDLGKVA